MRFFAVDPDTKLRHFADVMLIGKLHIYVLSLIENGKPQMDLSHVSCIANNVVLGETFLYLV
jgi:hypothetical protein